MPIRRFKVPHTLVLLFGMVILAQVLTYLLPAGAFERVENAAGRLQVVPGSFHLTPETESLSPVAMLTAIPKGFSAAEEIIFFIFIIGGAFQVLRATGAVDAALGALLRRLGSRPFWLVTGGILVFAVGSSTIGMAEEYLPFVPVLVALALALGYDTVTAVGIMAVGYGIGYGTALINPFTVLIAQDVAGLQPTSGLWFRLALLAVFLPIGIHHVWSYAKTVGKEPGRSLVADLPGGGGSVPSRATPGSSDAAPEEEAGADPAGSGIAAVNQDKPGADHPHMTGTHRWSLLAVVAALGILIWGLTFWHWYLIEMGALFVALTIVLAVIARMSPDRTAIEFGIGAADLTTTALMVGVARGIQVVLDEGGVVDTIVHGISLPLQQLPGALSAVGMFFVQSVANFFIPSGSGQAYVTMPIMAPLADLVGVSRQVAVLAYQFGDGFTNILVPTNAVIVGILAMAAIPFDRWVRFVFPFMVKIWVVGSVALAVAVAIGYR
ncbi:MAG: YfcC family protein [Longimicrobiales bacterium]